MAGITGTLAVLIFITTSAIIYSIVVLGLNLQWGYTGLFNISIAAFWGIGAYTATLVTLPPDAPTAFGLNLPYLDVYGIPLPLAPAVILAALVSGVVAFLIGIPTLRLREDYLAIATLGLAEVIRLILLNESWMTQGAMGISVRNPIAGMDYSGVILLIASLGLLIVVYWLLETGVQSPWGRVLKAIREDENVAKSVGKDTFSFKMQSLVLGSMVMGAAGALTALQISFLTPGQFVPIWSFYFWIAVIIGGSGNNRGAILGGFTLAVLLEAPRYLRDFIPFQDVVTNSRLLIIGALLIIIVTYRPSGLLGERRTIMGGDEE
ncbi:MAG: branched-chain amino acid ABC transporter permease [Halobacteria archaeon]|nr:branched-chain amino acid ABC transporter permease [Halobacteria archaeon]